MKALRTDSTDLELTLPGAGEDRTLPAQRIQAFDPELGETEADAHPAVVSTWNPDDGERKALANGAPLEVVLHLPAERHPPISLAVGEPDAEASTALLTKAHVDRAVGFWFTAVAKKLAEGDMGTPKEVLELWHEALEQTREGAAPVDLGERINDATAAIEQHAAGENGDEAA